MTTAVGFKNKVSMLKIVKVGHSYFMECTSVSKGLKVYSSLPYFFFLHY